MDESARWLKGLTARSTSQLRTAMVRSEGLIRVKLDGSRVVNQERLLQGKYGRIREVAEGPDGAIYISTSNRDGQIGRLDPSKARRQPCCKPGAIVARQVWTNPRGG